MRLSRNIVKKLPLLAA